jgi:hypothetical protein
MMPQGHSNSENAVTNLITKTNDFFHSAVRAPCGQLKPFHQSNKFLRGGKLSMVCSGCWKGDGESWICQIV